MHSQNTQTKVGSLMKLDVLDEVLALSKDDIEEQLAVVKSELAQGFTVDQFGNEDAIDIDKFVKVQSTLERALAIKISE